MIKNIWEFGYAKNETSTEMGYGIAIITEESSPDKVDFKGTDVNKVHREALKFIFDYYRPKENLEENK